MVRGKWCSTWEIRARPPNPSEYPGFEDFRRTLGRRQNNPSQITSHRRLQPWTCRLRQRQSEPQSRSVNAVRHCVEVVGEKGASYRFQDWGMLLAKWVEESGHNRSWIERISATAIGRARGNGLNTSNGSGLPSFFVIGPPRTGTTWLYEILRDRTLLPAPTKETRFFDKHFHRGIDWYRAHYPHTAADRHVGEIAPTYFASIEASERIVERPLLLLRRSMRRTAKRSNRSEERWNTFSSSGIACMRRIAAASIAARFIIHRGFCNRRRRISKAIRWPKRLGWLSRLSHHCCISPYGRTWSPGRRVA